MTEPLKDPFTQKVQQLRADYDDKRARSNLISGPSHQIQHLNIGIVNGILCYTYWYELSGQCLRLAAIPDILSGDILSLKQNVPDYALEGDFEIIGNQIRPLGNVPLLPKLEDDSEDLGALLTSLPILNIDSNNVDSEKYFLKESKYKSEISNLLKCQGGFSPGIPKSPHIIQLLGRSRGGKLVFRKFKPRWVLAYIYSLVTYKDWLLQIILGLKCLHSVGIVRRDIRIDNLVFTDDNTRVLICDREGRWGNRHAPFLANRYRTLVGRRSRISTISAALSRG